MAKEIKSRIISKHDIEANWLQAVNFIPKKGETIVYDIDDNYDYERLKLGDGVTKVNDLPFVHEQADWNQTDSTKADYIKNKPETGLEPLVGSTTTITPVRATQALEEGRNVILSHMDPVFGELVCCTWNAVNGQLVGSTVVDSGNGWVAYELYRLTDTRWHSTYITLAENNQLFTAVYGQTTHAEIASAIQTGKTVLLFVGEELGLTFSLATDSLTPEMVFSHCLVAGNHVEFITATVNTKNEWDYKEQELYPAVQSDWNETSSGTLEYIKNKPNVVSTETQTVIGKNHQENTDAVLIVGNGENSNDRSNIFEIISDTNKNVSLKLGTTQFTEKQLVKLINFLDTIRESGYEVTIFDMYGHVTYSKNDEPYQELPFRTPFVLSDVLDLKFKQESVDSIHIYTVDMSIDLFIDGYEGAISEPLNVEEDLRLYISLYGDNSVPYKVEPNFDVNNISYSTNDVSFSTWDNDIYVSRFKIRNDNDFAVHVSFSGAMWDDDINGINELVLKPGETSIWLNPQEDQVVDISKHEGYSVTLILENGVDELYYSINGEPEVKVISSNLTLDNVKTIKLINRYPDSFDCRVEEGYIFDWIIGDEFMIGSYGETETWELTEDSTLRIKDAYFDWEGDIEGEYLLTFYFDSHSCLEDSMYYELGENGDWILINDGDIVSVGATGIRFKNEYPDGAYLISEENLFTESVGQVYGGSESKLYYPIASGTITIYNELYMPTELETE